jgi:hypothetical protein
MGFDKCQDFLIFNEGRGRQHGQRLDQLRPMFHVAAGDFSNDEGVTYDQVIVQQPSEKGRIATKVVDPHGGIDQYGHD